MTTGPPSSLPYTTRVEFVNKLDSVVATNVRLLSTMQSQVKLQRQIIELIRELREAISRS